MKQLTFITAFVIGVLMLQMITGDKMTEQFLILVLVSMVLLNTDKVINLLGRVNTNE